MVVSKSVTFRTGKVNAHFTKETVEMIKNSNPFFESEHDLLERERIRIIRENRNKKIDIILDGSK